MDRYLFLKPALMIPSFRFSFVRLRFFKTLLAPLINSYMKTNG